MWCSLARTGDPLLFKCMRLRTLKAYPIPAQGSNYCHTVMAVAKQELAGLKNYPVRQNIIPLHCQIGKIVSPISLATISSFQVITAT